MSRAIITYTPPQAETAAHPVKIPLPLSKSESNRLLIINRLAGIDTPRHSVASCDDTEAIVSAFKAGDNAMVNVGAAGTAMRFLTAYYAATPGCDIVLDGSERMRKRPIGQLVDGLRQAGANIMYTGREGYPPLHIVGRRLEGGSVEIDADVSSQYISALLMVAPTMTLGLHLTLKGHPVSLPYVMMTVAMMEQHGVSVDMHANDAIDYAMIVKPSMYRDNLPTPFHVEGDWSAASYWFEATALTGRRYSMTPLLSKSIQGDATVVNIFAELGVAALNDDRHLTVTTQPRPGDSVHAHRFVELDMQWCPDLAQTVVATCCGLGRPFRITGLSTLPIKETDRLEALRIELGKLGFDLTIENNDTLLWDGQRHESARGDDIPVIDTYDDHRMAMAMAPLSAVVGPIAINQPDVVSKSYPDYWLHLSQAGFHVSMS